ncbi:MAG: hypothetical protein LBT02_00525 [Rickettsiales bacterium]|nr:hypothetical protein [Rickettsiales bacterium]
MPFLKNVDEEFLISLSLSLSLSGLTKLNLINFIKIIIYNTITFIISGQKIKSKYI